MIASCSSRICVERRSRRHSRGRSRLIARIIGPPPARPRGHKGQNALNGLNGGKGRNRRRQSARSAKLPPRRQRRARSIDEPKGGSQVIDVHRCGAVSCPRSHCCGALRHPPRARPPRRAAARRSRAARRADQAVEEGVGARLLREPADRELQRARRAVPDDYPWIKVTAYDLDDNTIFSKYASEAAQGVADRRHPHRERAEPLGLRVAQGVRDEVHSRPSASTSSPSSRSSTRAST